MATAKPTAGAVPSIVTANPKAPTTVDTSATTTARPSEGGPAGVDPALLAWIMTNYPGATGVHTGDAGTYLNGQSGSGVVFTYTNNGKTYTYLLPNTLPQYGIGGVGSHDTEPAYMHDPALNDGGISTAANPSAGQATQAALVPQQRQYSQVDNGESSLVAYGFGQNRYTQGAPVGGYDSQYNLPSATVPSPSVTSSGLMTHNPTNLNYVTSNTTPSATATTATAGAAGTTATGGLSTDQRNAWAYLQGLLGQYGLGSLSQFVISELTAGRSQDEIALDLQQTPEFKAAFPEIAARQQAGLPAISPGEIVSYRNSAIQLMKAAGLPQGFYDQPQDLQNLISNDVSLSELNDRINAAKDATYNIDPAAQARLHQEFGLAPGSGELAAYFLDSQRALPLLQRQLQAAQIGGAADTTGYGGVNNATALDLAQAGVTAGQAQQGFNTLGNEGQLFTGLPGQAEQNIGQGQQLAAQFLGNVSAQQVIEQRRQARLAAFNDGGGYAATSKGTAAGSAGQG